MKLKLGILFLLPFVFACALPGIIPLQVTIKNENDTGSDAPKISSVIWYHLGVDKTFYSGKPGDLSNFTPAERTETVPGTGDVVLFQTYGEPDGSITILVWYKRDCVVEESVLLDCVWAIEVNDKGELTTFIKPIYYDKNDGLYFMPINQTILIDGLAKLSVPDQFGCLFENEKYDDGTGIAVYFCPGENLHKKAPKQSPPPIQINPPTPVVG